MTAATISPTRVAQHEQSPNALNGLSVEREDIVFSTPHPGLLRVEITIRNTSANRTAETCAVLRSAPLGAFVPWQFLDIVQVPVIEPGESVVIRKEYQHETPRALGSIDKLPPNRVLTALGLNENEPERDPQPQTPALANDLLQLLQLGSSYWAGNLNLFFPGVDIERHAAQSLRIYPGRTNLAMFIVGEPTDAYQFELTGDAIGWNARLYDADLRRPIAKGVETPELQEGVWHKPVSGLLLLAIEPPTAATTGAVNALVRQRSSRREAVVEFTMDSRAAGPGCYKI